MKCPKSICSILLTLLLIAAGADKGKAGDQIKFIRNQKQWNPNVLYKADIPGGMIFTEKNRFTYLFYHPDDMKAIHKTLHGSHEERNSFNIRAHAYRVEFLGSNPNVIISGNGKRQEYYNYFIGNDPAYWSDHVPAFNAVHYNDIYTGTDIQLYSKDNALKYDIVIHPGGVPDNIRLAYSGVPTPSLRNGNLLIQTSVGDIIEQKPYAYQVIDGNKHTVACAFHIDRNVVTFELPEGYDKSHTLTIDPILIASTLSGSSVTNYGHCATYDHQGNIFTGAISFGPGYPVTNGAFQVNFAGGVDIGISKLNTDGSNLIFATYIGGSAYDYPHSLIVNDNEELYIYGSSESNNYPTSTNAFDNSFNGGWSDIVVTKLTANGTGIVGSTYIGGSDQDGQNIIYANYGDEYRGEIMVDSTGNCYIASMTSSQDFPVSGSAFQNTIAGNQDGCVFKLNDDLSSLVWSTYLGGTGNDASYGLRLDSNYDLYVVGSAGNGSFPTTGGTVYPNFQGGTFDGYIAHMQGNGSALLSGTFYGTADEDQLFFVDLDPSDNVYVYGQSNGGSMPVIGNVYSNPNSAQFISKLNPALSTVAFSTVFGSGTGSYDISPTAFMVDICNNVYISGHTGFSSTALPTTNGAFQTTGGFYLAVFSPDASSLFYATHYGGSSDHVDGGTSRFDNMGIVYQGVCTGGGFPTTTNAWSSNMGGSWDIGVFKIDFQAIGVIANSSAAPSDSGCAPFTVNFQNNSTGAVDYLWDFGDNSQTDTSYQPSHTYTNSGTYTVTLIAIDSTSCNFSDTFYLQITVVNPDSILADFTVNLTTGCDSLLLSTNNTSIGVGLSYLWDMGDGNTYTSTNVTHTYQDTGQYTVTLIIYDSICNQTDTATLIVDMYDTLLVIDADFTIDQNNCDQTVTASNTSTGNNLIYDWDFSGTHYYTEDATHTYSSTGTYTIILTITDTICNKSDTSNMSITIYPGLEIEIGPDKTVCRDEPFEFTLDAGVSGLNYLWSTGETGQSITANQTGTYWLIANDSTCQDEDTLFIREAPVLPVSGDTTEICTGEYIVLDASSGGASYLWNTGATGQTIAVDKAGIYSFMVIDEYGCEYSDTILVTLNESSSQLWFPNTLTPNGDGLNDLFRPVGYGLNEYKMTIFDRWGHELFFTEEYEKAWDGKVEGTDRTVQNGVYVYKVIYASDCSGGKRIYRVGHVNVIR